MHSGFKGSRVQGFGVLRLGLALLRTSASLQLARLVVFSGDFLGDLVAFWRELVRIRAIQLEAGKLAAGSVEHIGFRV